MFRKYASLQVLEAWQVPAAAGSRALRKAAHRVEFEYEPRPGYLYVRSRMISSRCNDNHDEFPAGEIEQGWKSFVGKPVFVNHHNSNHRRARGVIVAASLHRDRNPDGTPDTWVEGLMEVDAVRFPLLAKAILAKRVNRTSMGVDVEWSKCSACGNKATSPAEYCRHLPALKGKKIRRRASDGKLREEIIREVCHGLSFFENSLLVEDPADPTAYVLGEPDARGLKMTAAAQDDEPDFRDHLGNHCLGCGKQVRWNPRKGHVHYNGNYGYDHAPMPSDPEDKSSPATASFGGTHCLMCREPVKISLNHLHTATGGWSHHDGMKRDHPAIPADAQAVYDAIPGVKARYEQARQQVGDQLHSQMEELHGGPMPRRPRGDEDQMPKDPFTAARRTAGTVPEPFEVPSGVNERFPGPSRCTHCGTRFESPGDSRSAVGNWRHMQMPHLCNDCAIGHVGQPSEDGKPPSLEVGDKGGYGSRENTDRMQRRMDEGTGGLRGWTPDDALRHSTSSRKTSSRRTPMRTTAPLLSYVPLMAEAASQAYPNPADHPFYKANPVSAQNVVDKFHQATDNEKALGARWYSDAHHIAKAVANNDAKTGAGLLSAYSPQTGWGVNMHNASKAYRGHRPGEPESIPGKGSGAMGMHQKAAHRILEGEDYNSVLRAPKTNAFANLIEHGDDSPEDKARGHSRVVVDRHAMSVSMGRRTHQDDDLSFLGNPHYYEHTAQTYRDAAHEINQKHGTNYAPHQIQAITWGVQKRQNDEENAGTATGKGRISRERNDDARWRMHADEAHPDLPRGPGGNMHVSKAGSRKRAADETKMPSQVNTLRAENCPVCGESDAWSGERCPVCGFVTPPSMFRDPDTDKASEVRDELDNSGEVNLPPESEEAERAGGPDGATAGPPQGSSPDADRQLDHPDQIAPDGVPTAQGPDTEAPAEQNPEDPSEAGQDEANAQASAVGCPACGAQLGAEEPGAQEGAMCPQCQNGRLAPVGNPAATQKEQRPSGPGGTVMGSAREAAADASARRQAALEQENRVLRAQLAMLGSLAGVGPEMDAIRRQADMANPASPVPDPPEQPATQTTEEALAAGSAHSDGGQQGSAPMGGGHAVDDPSRPGTTPGSVTNVPAAQTTTAITPGVEIPTPPATNLVDVTAPVTGTNPSQDGGVPIQQRRIETDVRIDPDPLKANGPGIGGQGNDGTAFPWVAGGDAQGNQKAASAQDQAAERTFASIRLAKLRVTAGLDQGDELSVAAGIERDASLTLPVISREIETLSRVASAAAPRRGQQRTASRAPSLAAPAAPMMAYASAASMDADDASDLFLD